MLELDRDLMLVRTNMRDELYGSDPIPVEETISQPTQQPSPGPPRHSLLPRRRPLAAPR
jgi:hypothetical protein